LSIFILKESQESEREYGERKEIIETTKEYLILLMKNGNTKDL